MSKTTLIVEYLSATTKADDASTMAHEGWGMLDAFINDFLAVYRGNIRTILAAGYNNPRGSRVQVSEAGPDPLKDLQAHLDEVDNAFVIAPECDGILSIVVTMMEESGKVLRQPGRSAVLLFGDKLATHKNVSGVIPTLALGDLGDAALNPTKQEGDAVDWDGEVILKPRYGAGSMHTLRGPARRVEEMERQIRDDGYSGELILQPFWSGMPVSNALIQSATGVVQILPTCQQQIHYQAIENRKVDQVGSMSAICYQGGRIVSDPATNDRSCKLIERVLPSFPKWSGYLGVDLILGEDRTGSQDRILEVNPRLTTSYLGYRRLYGPSLVAAVLGDDVILKPIIDSDHTIAYG